MIALAAVLGKWMEPDLSPLAKGVGVVLAVYAVVCLYMAFKGDL